MKFTNDFNLVANATEQLKISWQEHNLVREALKRIVAAMRGEAEPGYNDIHVTKSAGPSESPRPPVLEVVDAQPS